MLRSLAVALLLALTPACAHAAPPTAATATPAPPRLAAVVDQAGWRGPWLPTMDVLSVPVLDWLSPVAGHAAKAYVERTRADVAAVVAAYGALDRERHARVAKLVAKQPLAAAGLARLALDGTLVRPSPLYHTHPTLLSALDDMATEDLAKGIDRAHLLGDTLAELDVPARVTQGAKLTCESASVQILLAERCPAEYGRLVAALAAEPGLTTLAGGPAVGRPPDWASPTDGWRSLPGRLLQCAFATYGNAPWATTTRATRTRWARAA